MVERWDVIVIGSMSANYYWSESDEKPVRPAVSTCTLITGRDFRLLVDPPFADAERMVAELDRRSGLRTEDIDAVFVTHEHGDHVAGLAHFSSAAWLAAPTVAEIINASDRWPVESAPRKLFDAVDVVHTPGHTLGHHGLRFQCDGLSVVVAGDAVMNRDFWADRRPSFNAVDPEVAVDTMNELAAMADVMVPGHDNYFLVRRGVFQKQDPPV